MSSSNTYIVYRVFFSYFRSAWLLFETIYRHKCFLCCVYKYSWKYSWKADSTSGLFNTLLGALVYFTCVYLMSLFSAQYLKYKRVYTYIQQDISRGRFIVLLLQTADDIKATLFLSIDLYLWECYYLYI